MSAENNKETEKRRENSYRSILKGTSFFGGVQVFQVLVNLVRGKFVAMFLGPEGMGVSSLFSSSANTISQFSTFGMNLALTKEVAASRDDPSALALIGRVARELLMAGATLGALFTIIFAPWLSRVTFGSDAYSWQFVALSLVVWLTVAGSGKMALLQGLHKVKILSKTSVIGAVVGLVVGVPLYYFFGVGGIVPAMIVLALSTFAFYSWGVRKSMPRPAEKSCFRSRLPLMKKILSLGLVLMLTTFLATASIYLMNTFIRLFGDMDAVGLYSAANSLTNQYAGVVFMAMSMDYFPRLAAVGDDKRMFDSVVNRQIEIVALIAAPAVILMIATSPLIIKLLLTDEFLVVTPLMRWMGLGILLKALAFPLGYITFAKNNRKAYLWLEGVACNLLYLVLGMSFYYWFGLIGLGYAMVIEYAGCILLYYMVNRRLYCYQFSGKALRQMGIATVLAVACFLGAAVSDATLSVTVMALTFTISAAFSFLRLRKLIRTKE